MAKILIMDDEIGIRLILTEILTQKGHEIITAGDGPAGLRQLENEPSPDIVIVDYRLPTLNGKDVLEKMNMNAKYKNIPRILMSGSPPDSEEFPPENTYQAFVIKPFDLFAMANLVENCLKTLH